MSVSLTFGTAMDEMKEHFNERWIDGIANGLPDTPAIIFTEHHSTTPYDPEIDWHNVEEREVNDNGRHWVRFVLHNNLRFQETLSNPTVGTVFETQGIVNCQLFLSRSAYTTAQHYLLAEICEAALTQKRTPNCVWFRNAVIRNLPPSENYFRCNVTAEYIFDSTVN